MCVCVCVCVCVCACLDFAEIAKEVEEGSIEVR